jgi:hypothetical protein
MLFSGRDRETSQDRRKDERREKYRELLDVNLLQSVQDLRLWRSFTFSLIFSL